MAGESPLPLSPDDNSTVSQSKLTWQPPSYSLYSTNPYRIQVDNNSDFSSPDKDYYTKNNYYTPSLSDGIWYWQVKAKDSAGTWSDWSNTWNFNFSAFRPTPAPTPSPTPIPTPVPSPSPLSAPTNTPTPSSSTASSFVVSNIPNQINSDQSLIVSVNLLLSNKPNANFYLKGTFKKTDGLNYFGKTKVSGSWAKNSSSYSNQFQITIDSQGNWSGNLEVMPDIDDSGYTGSGDYIFKVGRYDTFGSGPTWSNDTSININDITSTAQTDQTTSTVSNNTQADVPSTKSLPSAQTSYKPTSNKLSIINPKSLIKIDYRIASVAGASISAKESTPSEKINQKVNNKTNFFLIGGITFISMSITFLGYLFLKTRGI